MISVKPSLHLKPVAYKTNKLYLKLPEGSIGNMTFARTSVATRVNNEGLIEEVATGIPRLDHALINGVVQSCPELLLEPVSTNLLLRSDDFANSYWTKQRVSVLINQIISPDGTLTADKITPDTQNITHYLRRIYGSTTPASLSIFAKANGYDWIKLSFNTNSSGYSSAYFDIKNGVIGTVSDNPTAKIINFGNGWFRCTITGNTIQDTNSFSDIMIADADNSNTFIGDNIKSVHFWGAQLEQLLYSTSYMKTVASTVTRATETLINAGDSTTFNSAEGVLYVEMAALFDDGTNRILSISNGLPANQITIRLNSTANTIRVEVTGEGSTSMDTTFDVGDTLIFHKVAVKWKVNDFAFWVDGIEITADNSGSAPVGLDNFQFRKSNNTLPFFGRIRELKIQKTALTNLELEELTI